MRKDAAKAIHDKLTTTDDKSVAAILGVSAALVSRVLRGKNQPGNRFIAAVISECGLDFAFNHVFYIQVGDETQPR